MITQLVLLALGLQRTTSGTLTVALTVPPAVVLPRDSVVTVALEQEIKGQKGSLSTLTYSPNGKSAPLRFFLPYSLDPAKETGSLSLVAKVTSQGKVVLNGQKAVTLSASIATIEIPLAAPTAVSFMDKDWILVELDGSPMTWKERIPTLRFSSKEKVVAGSGGVNRFQGGFTLEGDQVTVANVVSTKMGGPPERMNLEMKFFGAIQQADRVVATADELRLMKGETVLVRFRPAAR